MELFDMLDWHQPESVQEEGRRIARTITDITQFIQPLSERYSKNVWDNCAMIVTEKTDPELEPFLKALLEWTQDLNWPGALMILNRLKVFSNSQALEETVEQCLAEARAQNDDVWEKTLLQLIR